MAKVVLLGVPWDEHSSFLRGAAQAPAAIREALHSPSTNLSTESGLDLDADPRFVDAGDLEIPPGDAALHAIVQGAAGVLASERRLLALGGDHAVTYPLLRAHAPHHPGLTIVHLDAHPDLYDEFEGDRLSHASPFARIPEADEILIPDKLDAPFDSVVFGPDSYIVIVTRGHIHDEIVLRRALQTSAGYIGMIGSKKKRETIYRHLLDEGFTQADIARVYSPIGIDISADTPEEIAVSITAELIKVRAAKKAE
jgi:arginase family enzyme